MLFMAINLLLPLHHHDALVNHQVKENVIKNVVYYSKIRERNQLVKIVVLEETEATAGDMDMNNKSDDDDSNQNICSKAMHVSKPAPSNYSFHQVAHIDIAPVRSTLDKLSINSQSSISIPPRPVYHPAIHQACQAMFGKHPTSLTPEEVSKFKIYQRQKLKNNDSIENDVIYQPIGGIRTCIQCGNLT